MTPTTAPVRRARPLRVESDSVLWFVTCRTIEERYWLHPIISCGLEPPSRKARRKCKALERHCDKRLTTLVRRANARKGPHQPELTLSDAKRLARGLVGSALARAQKHCDVKVYALVVMSNHVHMVVQTTRKNLASFMGYFKARVTENVNLLTGKRGPLWARRYDAQPIHGDAAATDRIAYTVDNPCKASLVEAPEHWPGLNLAFGMGDSDELHFEYLDRTAWHRARRPGDLSDFFEGIVLTLSPAPSCEGLSRDNVRTSLASWLEQLRAKEKAKGRKRSKRVLDFDKIVHAGFEARPDKASFGKRPYVFCAPEERLEHYKSMMLLLAGHRDCSERFRAGERTVVFPEGTYPPPLLEAA